MKDYVYTTPLIRFNNIRSFTADQLQLFHSSEPWLASFIKRFLLKRFYQYV